jgi:signal transduction histidine kinase
LKGWAVAVAQPDYTQRLERLLEISRKLASNLDQTTLLQSICEATSELIDCQDGSILIQDEDPKFLKFVAGPWDQISLMKQFRVPIEKSISGWVFSNSKPLVIQDALRDPRIYRQVDHALHYQTRSLISAPMIFQTQPIGVLQAVNKHHELPFSSDDVSILETLSAQAAIALHNAQLMEKSEEAYRQMIELDRMKSDFIAITSHELRTPLGLILAHATYLHETVSPDQVPQLDVILRSAMRLKEIVEEFYNVDNFKSGMAILRSQPVDIAHLVTDTVDSFHPQAKERNINLSVDAYGGSHTIECDPRKVRIALENIIKNALNFTNPDGNVWVKATYPVDSVRISVSDDGIGIPEADQPKIFERFYQVESHIARRQGGMGLGLSIARDMIEMHGGKIKVESVEGHGSRFTIQLPVRQPEKSG